MRFAILSLSLLCGLLSLEPVLATKIPPNKVSELDRVVAIVNDEVITETELESRLIETKKQLTGDKIRLPADSQLRRQLLERLIQERIQLQIAAQAGIQVTDSDVEQAVQGIAARNNLSMEGMYQMLKREGIEASTYRSQIRNQITVQQLLEREINNRITVTDSEINNFIQNRQGQAGVEDEYNLSHIFIGVPESATAEQIQTAKRLTEKVHGELKTGEDFARTAVTYSTSPDALKGGALGWRKAGQLPELFLKALAHLPRDGISEVLRGPNGFHILKLNDQRGADRGEEVTYTHVRHILLRPSEIQSIAEATNTLKQLRQRIENGEDFAALARAYSEDTASIGNGGDLGWIAPQQLVPEFERAMNKLAPLALSEPVKTAFGVHLIQVVERQRRDAGEERARAAARKQIHARKSEDRFEQWMRQLRDEAFVEYLLEE